MKKYSKIGNYANRHHAQAGMTLIELTVVLMILVGLAGLLIPYVSGFMEKTHDSTTVSTISELNNTIQRYQVSKLGLPTNLETLLDNTAGTVYNKMQNTTAPFIAPVAAADLPFANASLAKAGVTTVLNNDNATDDATFKSTTGAAQTLTTNPFAAGTGVPLAQLVANNTAQADQTFFGQLSTNLVDATNPIKNQLMYAFGGTQDSWDTACTTYVVMGIGSASSLIPSAMQSAPVHFGGSAGEAPATVYARFVAVFAVPNAVALSAPTTFNGAGACPKADAPAKFIGTAAIFDFPAIVGLNGAQQWANANLSSTN